MKNFLLFAGDKDSPCGGWEDCRGDFDSLIDTLEKAADLNCDWWHIVEVKTKAIVRSGEKTFTKDIFFLNDCATFIRDRINENLSTHFSKLPGSPAASGMCPKVRTPLVETKIKELYDGEQSAREIWGKHKKQLIAWAKEIHFK